MEMKSNAGWVSQLVDGCSMRSNQRRLYLRLMAILFVTMFVQVPFMQPSSAALCADQGPELENPASPPDSHDWGDPETLQDHFDRHGPDFGSSDKFQYADQAHQFYVDKFGDTTNVKVKRDKLGTTRLWEQATNKFGSYNKDGSTRTFFKPKPKPPTCADGEEY